MRNIYKSNVEVFEVNKNGKVLSKSSKENTKGVNFHKILAGIASNQNAYSIRFFKIGSNNTPNLNPNALNNDITGGNLDIDYKYIENNDTAVFELRIGTGSNTYNGQTIGECGLFSLNGTLLARYTFTYPKVKLDDVTIIIIWKIKFI